MDANTERQGVLDLVEQEQLRLLHEAGLTERKFSEIIEARITQDPIAAEPGSRNDLHIKEYGNLERYYRSIERLTEYQCPYAKDLLEDAWTESGLLTGDRQSPALLGSSVEPYLLTTIGAFPYANSVRADDGSCAVVIDEFFFSLAEMLSTFFPRAYFSGLSGEFNWKSQGDYYLKHVTNISSELMFVITQFRAFVQARSLMPDERFPEKLHPIDPELKHCFYYGFLAMILNHERCHFDQEDHGKSDFSSRNTKDEDMVNGALKIYGAKYAEILPVPRPERFADVFLDRQSVEHSCDLSAFLLEVTRFQSSTRQAADFSRLLGAIWALYSLDLLETSIRLGIGGSEFAFLDLWGDDSYVDDLCLRAQHPSPYSRLRFLLEVIPARDPDEDRREICRVLLAIVIALKHFVPVIAGPNKGPLYEVHPRSLALLHTRYSFGDSSAIDQFLANVNRFKFSV